MPKNPEIQGGTSRTHAAEPAQRLYNGEVTLRETSGKKAEVQIATRPSSPQGSQGAPT